ncbi:F-box protein [Cucumis melo var. makuwa]|uniref:F-box protein n=1 Tax=Cucumis melo var. makuwa TaxID=1194695 RepID=A0A5D3BVH7_CUCMM|nr:F-box protein [Cucumis melo var. makuwa]
MKKPESKNFMNKGWKLPPHIVQVIFSKLPFYDLPTWRVVSKTCNDLVLGYASSCKSLSQAFLFFTSEKTSPVFPSSSSCYFNHEMHAFCTNNYMSSSVTSSGVDTHISHETTIGMHAFCTNNMSSSVTSSGVDTHISHGTTIGMHAFCTNNMISSVTSSGVDTHICHGAICVITSCNGLLFAILSSGGVRYCGAIINPLTNEFFELHIPPPPEDAVIGFGFSPKTNQYKLFTVLPFVPYSEMQITKFDRHGTNRCKDIMCLPFNIDGHGSYLNGFIYWIGREQTKFVIYALDVETEKIEWNTTLDVGTLSFCSGEIQTLNGSIYVTVFMYEPSHMLQVWRMQGKDSWIRTFVIYDVPKRWWSAEYFQLVKIFEYGTVMFLVDGDLFCIDTSGKKVKMTTFYPDNKLVTRFSNIDALNFGSLPAVLGE